jgi:hypothetical protein
MHTHGTLQNHARAHTRNSFETSIALEKQNDSLDLQFVLVNGGAEKYFLNLPVLLGLGSLWAGPEHYLKAASQVPGTRTREGRPRDHRRQFGPQPDYTPEPHWQPPASSSSFTVLGRLARPGPAAGRQRFKYPSTSPSHRPLPAAGPALGPGRPGAC